LKINLKIDRPIARDADSQALVGMFGLTRRRQDLYRDFPLELAGGQVTAVVGPSGSGKSALLAAIRRALPGSCVLEIAQLSNCPLPAIMALTAKLPHSALRTPHSSNDLAERLSLLSRCGLAEAMALVTPARRLSGGQLYRLALARAIWQATHKRLTAEKREEEFNAEDAEQRRGRRSKDKTRNNRRILRAAERDFPRPRTKRGTKHSGRRPYRARTQNLFLPSAFSASSALRIPAFSPSAKPWRRRELKRRRERKRLACLRRGFGRQAGAGVVLVDEFGSTLDEATAGVLARQVGKLARRHGLAFVLATPHSSLLESLRPDHLVVKPLGLPAESFDRLTTLSEAEGQISPQERENKNSTQRTQRNAEVEDAKTKQETIRGFKRAAERDFSRPRTKRGTKHSGRRPYRARTQNLFLPSAFSASSALRIPAFSPPSVKSPVPGRWRVVRGRMADYHALAPFHYLAGRPAAVNRIWTIPVPKALRRIGAPGVAAVLVVSPPVLLCRGRNVATGGRYKLAAKGEITAKGKKHRTAKAIALLNAELECISRVIVHPVYRSCGLAVRLVRHALRCAGRPRVEALAAMGAMHPFFELAGMTCRGRFQGVSREYTYYLAENDKTAGHRPQTTGEAKEKRAWKR
jgi:ABC-type nitrate/sulfonate/bicarbonate transport system ATPase subunit/GNAT superfamily N-acetyltransferase